ncbi:MAG: DUF814 domain-containing protein [Candidatus Eisenbacteria bacterium]|nr:DUF814 domain-containing protein [Candidatus Eisenbacteria bacterium]
MQAAGSVVVSLSPQRSGSGVTIELSRTSAVGRSFGRTIEVSLGRERDVEGVPSSPTVTWWRDRSGRLHARLSLEDPTAPAGSGPHARETRSFGSLNEGACFMFDELWPVLEAEKRRDSLATMLTRRLRRTERAIEKVKSELRDAARAEEYRHKGQLLLTRQSVIPRSGDRVSVTDYDGETRLTIELDRSLGIQQNAEVFFRKARKAERRGLKAPRRLSQLEAEALELRREVSELAGAGAETLRDMEERLQDNKPRQGGKPAEALPRFRTYVVSGGWEVLVGKSSSDNDALTHKMARPDDLWFHARQVPGSHVILRRSGSRAEPDKRAILEAAAIAAFHSKAGKSSKVSVCYTEKRHVRRSRGGQPGEAVITREKVVMVRPALPES